MAPVIRAHRRLLDWSLAKPLCSAQPCLLLVAGTGPAIGRWAPTAAGMTKADSLAGLHHARGSSLSETKPGVHVEANSAQRAGSGEHFSRTGPADGPGSGDRGQHG